MLTSTVSYSVRRNVGAVVSGLHQEQKMRFGAATARQQQQQQQQQQLRSRHGGVDAGAASSATDGWCIPPPPTLRRSVASIFVSDGDSFIEIAPYISLTSS